MFNLLLAFVIFVSSFTTLFLHPQSQNIPRPTPQFPTPSLSQYPLPTNPSPNWKTYTNNVLNISFEFPDKAPGIYLPLKIIEYGIGSYVVIQGDGNNLVAVVKYPNTTISKQFYLDKNQNPFGHPYPGVLKSGNLNGYHEQETLLSGADHGMDLKVIYFQRGGDVYSLSIVDESRLQDSSFLQQILSTFRFLN